MLTCTIHESADHVQLLLKYVETGIYDPADISRRSADKQYVVFSQIEFYLFCIPMECPSLCDIVRVGIQSGIEVMAWGPTLGDNDWFLVTDMGSPAHAGLLCWLCERGGGLFAELPDGDALKSSLLRYLNNLWQFYRTYFREGTAEFYINKDHKKVWEAMKLYRQNVPVDIYESDAVKYGVSEESSG